MKLEEKLSYLRKKKGFSQLELADTLGVTRQAVSRWEHGISLPSMGNLVGLSTLYGVDVKILTDDGAELPAVQEQSIEVVQTGCSLFTLNSRVVVVSLAWVLSVFVVCAAICFPFLFMSVSQNGEEEVISIEELNKDPTIILPEEYVDFDPW